ncbi:alpha/beta hydrolase [Devosia sp.]|uniref:alpha/beta fold hydrolase n=1 Tax=Devosia sp. TaxID=1871048 RepID=UPI00326570CE
MIRIATIVGALLLTSTAYAQSAPVGQYVSVNGMKVYYETSGEGEPLIVLHGAYMNIPSMGAIIPMLARTHQVIAVELQGHGRTSDVDRPITMEGMADDLDAFMLAIKLERADVFGYSMGAGVAVQLAVRHPEDVNHLVAASVSYNMSGYQPEFAAMVPSMTPEMFIGSPLETEYRKYAPDPDHFAAFVDKMIALEHVQQNWPEADIKGIAAPTLLIAGDSDVVTLEHVVSMFRLLGGGKMGGMGAPPSAARLAILPATEHTSIPSQPDLLWSVIEPFLQGQTPKSFMM